jgi:hypothetical protein
LGKKLKGSCIQSTDDFYANWFWVEDFTNNTSVAEKPLSPPEENMSDGVALTQQDLLYSFYANTSAVNYQWYIFAITERILKIGPGVVSLN